MNDIKKTLSGVGTDTVGFFMSMFGLGLILTIIGVVVLVPVYVLYKLLELAGLK